MQDYFLLNQYQNRKLLKKVWQFVAAPKLEYLFAQTELEQDKTQGPVLIYGDLAKLTAEYVANPADWPVLYIRTEATPDQLIKHLRSLLFVLYPPESKGVLTYYDTRTMHYFFNYTEQHMLATYLGPIRELKWYGATWLDQQNPTWHELTNQPNTAIELQPYSAITQTQQQGLSLARQHKYIYDWSKKMLIPINETSDYFTQAISLGFDSPDYLGQYMTLRANNPNKTIPENLQGNAEQKINYLQALWTEDRE